MVGRLVRTAAMAGGLALLCTASLSAQDVAASERTAVMTRPQLVTLSVKNEPLEAVLQLIAQQAKLTVAYGTYLDQKSRAVTLSMHDVPALDAFAKALEGTGLAAHIVAQMVVFAPLENVDAATGVITGTVIDAKTNRGMRGATVLLDNANKGVMTDDKGGFRITGVSAGTHILRVKMIGYQKASAQVTVTEGETAMTNLSLQVSVRALDEVVVTGTVIPTELKAVPNAITVITAKDIERRNITHIDQLFRGDVPGVFSLNTEGNNPFGQVTMYARGATALSSISQGAELGTNPIKTYVDGVEMADPKYLSQIDPRSIERIEIIPGPQASTIYGSNAINGVMQVFTKRGTSSVPQLTANLSSGWIQNNFSAALTPTHDYGTQLNGVEGRVSYNAGTNWTFTGAWNPNVHTNTLATFGGVRLELTPRSTPVSIDATFRQTNAHNMSRASSYQNYALARATGHFFSDINEQAVGIAVRSEQGTRTIGVTANYTPTQWWSHRVTVGDDRSDGQDGWPKGYKQQSDTLLRFSRSYSQRTSLQYSTTATASLGVMHANLTMGVDSWQGQSVTESANPPEKLVGSLQNAFIYRQTQHNTGGYAQGQLGVFDRLFLLYAVRAEWNPGFGPEATPNVAPRYGITYTQDIGPVTAKLRGAYGRATRPPQISLRNALPVTDAYTLNTYGPFDLYLASPELGPESQQGGEGGVELYFGTRGSLVVTRYNETVNNLIEQVVVDSVQRLDKNPDPNGYCTFYPPACGYGAYQLQYQFLNLASIRNQGWDIQGTLNVGPLTTKGTYSWVKTRSLGLTPKFRSQFPTADYPDYQPGATFRFLPEHTWGLSTSYTHAATSATLAMTGAGKAPMYATRLLETHLTGFIRLQQDRYNMRGGYGYTPIGNRYVMADLTVLHRVSSAAELLGQVQNISDSYNNDVAYGSPVMGRQTRIGVRLRFQ